MADQQAIDPSSFPDQPSGAGMPPPARVKTASGEIDPSSFPDQPGKPTKSTEPAKPGKAFLGDSTKKASIKPPETWIDYGKRKVKDVARSAYNALPDVGGAVGGAVGAAEGGAIGAGAGAVTVPFVGALPGVAVGATSGGMLGAAGGGMLGRYAQMLIDAARGKSDPKTPQSSSLAPDARVLKAGNEQMMFQGMGEFLAAPLGWIRRGGFIKMTPEIADTMAANAAYGTRLSGPEIATGSRAGNIAKNVQTYTGGAFLGGEIQKEARAKGAASATKLLDDAIRTIATPATKEQAGVAAEAGIGGAKAGLKTRGNDIERAIDNAGPLSVTGIKDEAVRIFQKDVLPVLVDYPDLTGKAKDLVKQLANDPTLIQKSPRPIMRMVANAVLEKTNSPLVKMLRTLIDTEDEVSFRGATQMRERLRELGKAPDDLMAGKTKGIASHFNQVFTDTLFAASPEYQKASSTYGVGARLLKSKAIDTLFSTALKEPQAVVDYITTPTRAKQLKRALVGLANQGPDAQRSKAAYDVIRSTLWTENIIKGGKEGAVDLLGMAGRIRSNEETLKVLFGDKQGSQVLAHGKAIAHLFEKQTPVMSGNFRKIFEIGRLVSGGIALARGNGAAGLTAGAIWEGFPDFFTWVIHDPKATNWFIAGVKADNPRDLTSNTIRLFERYREAHKAAAGQKKQPEGDPQ